MTAKIWLVDKKFDPDEQCFEYTFVSEAYWLEHHHLKDGIDDDVVYGILQELLDDELGDAVFASYHDNDARLIQAFNANGYKLRFMDLN